MTLNGIMMVLVYAMLGLGYYNGAHALTIQDSLLTSEIELPMFIKNGGYNFRIWGSKSMGASRIYTEAIAGDNIFVGWTGNDSSAYVSLISSQNKLVRTDRFQNYELRGLVAHDDGTYAVFLWDESATADNGIDSGRIYLKSVNNAGSVLWSTDIVVDSASPDKFTIGDSRVTYGDSKYGLYFHVGSYSGHEGDALVFVNADDGQIIANSESKGFHWGCSHSMSNILSYNPNTTTSNHFLPVCVTDCYPGTKGDFDKNSKGGIYVNNQHFIMDVAGECNGRVAAELGGVALAGASWRMVYNAHQASFEVGQEHDLPGNQDIAFVKISSDRQLDGQIKWLTNTLNDEANSAIARFAPASSTSSEYLVGWTENDSAYKLVLVDDEGNFVGSEGVVDVTDLTRWGERDDPFRTTTSGSVVWASAMGLTDDNDAYTNRLLISRFRSGVQTVENPMFTVLEQNSVANPSVNDPEGERIDENAVSEKSSFAFAMGGGILAVFLVAAAIITSFILKRRELTKSGSETVPRLT
eukprot:CFRG2380T1